MSENVTKISSNTSELTSSSKDIKQDDFYVISDTPEELELEYGDATPSASTKGHIQIMAPGDSVENLDEELPADDQVMEIRKKQEEVEDELGADFFEKGEDLDADKKQVVEEIAGMSETTDTEGDVAVETSIPDHEQSELTSLKSEIQQSSVQFKEKVTDDTGLVRSVELSKASLKKSIDRPSISIMRNVKKSISTDGSIIIVRKKSRQGSVFADSRFSFSRKDGADFGIPDYFAKQAPVYEGNVRVQSYAEFGPRYRQTDDDDFLDFDIGGDGAPIFFETTAEEEEEIVVQEEEAPVKLERKPFYDRHDKAAQEIIVRKMKNFILHKKLAMYFKRKKMDYVTREVDWSFDTQTKYLKKLGSYGDLMDFIVFEKVRVTQELDETKKLRVEKFNKLTSMFKKMQDREGEIGYGLISTKTGNALPDKFVERLIRRQNTQLTQVSSMRLTFIRLKGMVQEKLDSISNLNEIAPGFLLVDYEQLKSDNRAYADKIEEKDEELTRLRVKCGSTIQVLAHLREKTSALENDLEDLIGERESLESIYFDVRSQLNEQKQARDNVRHALNKMRDESGLLTQPTLLKDMEQGLSDIKNLTNQLKQIMKEHKKKSKQITTIRQNIEKSVDFRRGFSRKDLLTQSTTRYLKKDKSAKVYKGRPSLMMPVVEDSAFTHIRAIKPKFTFDRSHRNRTKVHKQSKRTVG